MLAVPDPFALAAERYGETVVIRPEWAEEAREDQLAPDDVEWFIWLILAGRGWGKTRVGAEWAAAMGRRYPGARIALVAATKADARDTMVEGESGLLSVLEDSELRGGSRDRAWNRSLGELFLANGTRFKCYSSEKPRQLRGPQQHFTWADEVAQWNDAKDGTTKDSTWSNLAIGTRLKPRPEWDEEFRTQIVATTTPRRVALLKVPAETLRDDPSKAGLLQRPDVAVTSGRTDDNLANLSLTYQQNVVEPLRGTRLGQQELDAKLLEDVEGALWTGEQIESDRVLPGNVPPLTAIVTAVDPATTNKETSAETGIVTVGRGLDDHGYTLADDSKRDTPLGWAVTAWMAALEHGSEAIVVEDNAGGDMVETNLAAAWPEVAGAYSRAGRLPPPVRRVHAVTNKRTRATPVALLYERHMWHHVTGAQLDLLEDQLTGWDGTGDSPDRLDALVHGVTWLFLPQAVAGKQTIRQPRWGTVNARR